MKKTYTILKPTKRIDYIFLRLGWLNYISKKLHNTLPFSKWKYFR